MLIYSLLKPRGVIALACAFGYQETLQTLAVAVLP